MMIDLHWNLSVAEHRPANMHAVCNVPLTLHVHKSCMSRGHLLLRCDDNDTITQNDGCMMVAQCCRHFVSFLDFRDRMYP